MKKNRTMRVAVLMLALTLITCCFVGSTFAKYASDIKGTDSVQVAKWAFNVGDKDAATAQEKFTFNLFDTILDTEAGDDNQYTEHDVAATKIAPGTKGSFTIALSNTSDVTARYMAEFDITSAPTNLKFSVNGGEYADTIEVDWTQIARGANGNIVVAWEWAFNGDVTTDDNDFGIAAGEVEVTATVYVEQVN